MTAIDERAELKRIANEAIAEINKLKALVVAATKRLDVVVNHLLSDADSLALAAADERAEGVKQTNVTYAKKESVTLTGRIDSTQPNITPPPNPGTVVPNLGPGKRACSNCRQPGHRAKNCPLPDQKALKEAQKKGLKTGRKK